MSHESWLKFLNFIFLALFMIGCGNLQPVGKKNLYSEPDKDSVLRSLSLPERTLDPSLTPFLDEFRSALDRRGLKERNKLVSLAFRDLPTGYAGYCVTKQINFNEFEASEGYVVIDSKLSDLQLRAVIWHELGHCLFNLKHTENQGIMNEYIPSDSQLTQKWPSLEGEYLQLIEKELAPSNQQSFDPSNDHLGFTLTPIRIER